jgi:ribosomal protein L24E
MDNPMKLATQFTKEKEKKTKTKKTPHNVRWTPLSASKHK